MIFVCDRAVSADEKVVCNNIYVLKRYIPPPTTSTLSTLLAQ